MALEETRKRITVDSETMHKNSSHKMWHKAEKKFQHNPSRSWGSQRNLLSQYFCVGTHDGLYF
jgi:hypothetical protein